MAGAFASAFDAAFDGHAVPPVTSDGASSVGVTSAGTGTISVTGMAADAVGVTSSGSGTTTAAPELRVTIAPLELAQQAASVTRVTDAPLEIGYQAPSVTRVTDAVLEVLEQRTSQTDVTILILEIARRPTDAAEAGSTLGDCYEATRTLDASLWDTVTVPIGAKLYLYVDGTRTPQAGYADPALTTALPNPVVADSTGTFPTIYLLDAVYSVVMKTWDTSRTLLTADGV